MLGELRRIGSVGRKQLIDAWSPHLPHDMDSADLGFEDLEPYMNNEEGTVNITSIMAILEHFGTTILKGRPGDLKL